jgi:hypothetical protein
MGLQRHLQPRQPVGADAVMQAMRASASCSRPSRSVSASRSQNGRSQARPSAAAPSAAARFAARALTKTSRRSAASSCCQRRRSWSMSCTAFSASTARERSRPCAAAGEKAWCLASRCAVAAPAAAGSPCARPAASAAAPGCGAPRRRQLAQQVEARGGVAVVECPLGGQQPRAVVGAAARTRSCARSRKTHQLVAARAILQPVQAAGGQQVPSTVNSVSLAQQLRSRPGSPARAARPCGRGCSGRRSTRPRPRARPPGRHVRGAAARHSPARAAG